MIRTLFVAAAVAALLSDPQVEAARARYRADAWPMGARKAGVALASLSVPGFANVAIPGSASSIELDATGTVVTRRFADASGKPSFAVDVQVAEDAAAAHEALLVQLAYVSSPGVVPSASSVGIPLGDAGYVGFATAERDRISWIAFARGNVQVRVSSFDPTASHPADLSAVARAIDAAIVAAPAVGAGVAVPRPSFTKLAAPKTSCVAGENLALSADAGGAELFWNVGGSGLAYVETAPGGSPVLHTTGSGHISLTAYAVSAMSTTRAKTIEIEVAPKR
ncbi:MAG TPA: hypothetical protein VKE69_09530 [Planctomycetota bacterium]|nr:hypothetical protein [Planctomycetota bacterium]